jgi:hypothetical protein
LRGTFAEGPGAGAPPEDFVLGAGAVAGTEGFVKGAGADAGTEGFCSGTVGLSGLLESMGFQPSLKSAWTFNKSLSMSASERSARGMLLGAPAEPTDLAGAGTAASEGPR